MTVGYSAEEVATEEVKLAEKQRIFGIIPNFYVSYDQNAAPLTAKLKFQLAAKVSYDPITLVGVGVAAAAEQAGNHPNYPQNWKGFGERQPNYSTIGGDLASAAISNAYYPASNRGVGLLLGNFLIGTGQRAAANLAQEFILRRLTHKPAR